MIKTQKAYIPLNRKTKNVYQWMGYINNKLKQSRLNEKKE